MIHLRIRTLRRDANPDASPPTSKLANPYNQTLQPQKFIGTPNPDQTLEPQKFIVRNLSLLPQVHSHAAPQLSAPGTSVRSQKYQGRNISWASTELACVLSQQPTLILHVWWLCARHSGFGRVLFGSNVQ